MTKKRVSRGEYEHQKKELTSKVNRIIDFEMKHMLKSVDKSIRPFLSSLWENRKMRAINNGRLRDMTVYLTLRMFGVLKLTEDYKKVIAAGEFFNMASYYQNWHLDDKKNVKGAYEAKLCHVASHFYREKAHELIMCTDFPADIKLQLLHELSESNKAIQLGQSLELAGDRIIDLQTKSEDEVVETYLQRCSGMSGRFYGASFAMGAIMAGAGKKEIDICREIGIGFGTGGQIINDVGDFCLVPSLVQLSEKDYQDQFADLMKGTMTLPIYELSKRIDLDKYHSRILSNDEKEKLLLEMIASKAFDSARKASNSRRNEIRKLFKDLPQNDASDLLKFQVHTFFNCNKFYVNLRENHGYKWSD